MWPPDFAHYQGGVHEALVESMHIAGMGTILALVMSLPVALLAAKNITPVPALNWLARLILVSSRSVNTLVWAILFVAVFGPGALAGTIAIGFRSIGFCGKLLGEALEECNKGPVEALKAAGAPWPSIFLKAYWPQVSPAFWGITLFRWDINVRESAVIGLVGAGGIGMALDTAIDLFRWTQVSLILLCIFAVVIVAEIVVTKIRQKII
jgi:phosphonate transport system permease protein